MRSEIVNGSMVYNQPLRDNSSQSDGKLRIIMHENNPSFQCPGCDRTHVLDTRWSWNRSLTSPTFYPSMVDCRGASICHFFVTDGKIQFQGDCTHDFKNRTIELPEIPR